MTSDSTTPQTAVWYFIAATFIFVAPVIFFSDSGNIWLSIGSIALGAAVFAMGLVVLRREWRARRAPQRPRDTP